MIQHPPSAEVLREWFCYDGVTGELRRKKASETHPQRLGELAGTVTKHGYVTVGFFGKCYRAHRLIWCMVTGGWPEASVDHINRDPRDNRWSNLRLADASTQTVNQKNRTDNKSGHRGVFWYRRRQKWRAVISWQGKRHHLGDYGHKEEAVASYQRAAKTLHLGF